MSCAECLALHGEVLLLSIRRSYVWIINGTNPVNTLPCGECGYLTEEIYINLDIYPLRPISSHRISKILATKDIDGIAGNNNVGSEASTSSGKRMIA